MLIPKFIQSIAKRISADRGLRPSLAGVHVTPTHLEATNSFMAVSIKNPFTSKDDKDYPANLRHNLENSIMVSKDELKLIPFKKSKKFAHLSDRAALVLTGEAGVAAFETCYADATRVRVSAQTLNGKFPSIRSFIEPYKDRVGYTKVGINPLFLIDILQTMSDAGYNEVTLSIADNKPVFVEPFQRVPEDDSVAILMNLKS